MRYERFGWGIYLEIGRCTWLHCRNDWINDGCARPAACVSEWECVCAPVCIAEQDGMCFPPLCFRDQLPRKWLEYAWSMHGAREERDREAGLLMSCMY